jgi:hypothetical protein
MDMSDCIEALENGESLSESEARKCVRMFEEIVDYLYNEGIEIDDDAFEEWKDNIMNNIDD